MDVEKLLRHLPKLNQMTWITRNGLLTPIDITAGKSTTTTTTTTATTTTIIWSKNYEQ